MCSFLFSTDSPDLHPWYCLVHKLIETCGDSADSLIQEVMRYIHQAKLYSDMVGVKNHSVICLDILDTILSS